jgi:diketogulonate reductase-like aldo/keto reductase
MEFKELGTSKLRLPEIGLATWKYAGGIDPLRAGIDHGASLIDTAEAYGTEEIVGEAIRGRRYQVFLATKVLPRNFRRRELIAAADRSLRRLGTDYIDLYQLHWPNYTIPIEEPIRAMEELVEAGKIRFIGVSNFSVRELKNAQAALSRHRIVSNQVRYSLVERTIEAGLLKYCQQNGITVIAYSPLGIGLPQILTRDPAKILSRVANAAGKTEVQVALNWLIAKDNVIAIPKASTVPHVVENCRASGWRLSQGDYDLMTTNIYCQRRGRIESAARRWAKRVLQLSGREL